MKLSGNYVDNSLISCGIEIIQRINSKQADGILPHGTYFVSKSLGSVNCVLNSMRDILFRHVRQAYRKYSNHKRPIYYVNKVSMDSFNEIDVCLHVYWLSDSVVKWLSFLAEFLFLFYIVALW